MRDIVLIAPQSYNFESIQKALPKQVQVIFDNSGNRLVVKWDERKAFVEFELDNTVSDYYDEPEDVDRISHLGECPRFFLVHFKDIEDLKFVIKSVANRSDVLIDNDFGLIEAGNEFVRRCEESPGWDWVKS